MKEIYYLCLSLLRLISKQNIEALRDELNNPQNVRELRHSIDNLTKEMYICQEHLHSMYSAFKDNTEIRKYAIKGKKEFTQIMAYMKDSGYITEGISEKMLCEMFAPEGYNADNHYRYKYNLFNDEDYRINPEIEAAFKKVLKENKDWSKLELQKDYIEYKNKEKY